MKNHKNIIFIFSQNTVDTAKFGNAIKPINVLTETAVKVYSALMSVLAETVIDQVLLISRVTFMDRQED